MPARPRVLLVEDDPAIRRLVELALEDEALALECCADGLQALERLSRGPVRLLITDLMMPGLSGLELLERLQAEPGLRAGARLAVFSAGLSEERRARLAALGVEAFFDKPVAIAALIGGVHDLLEPEQGSSPHQERALREQFGGDTALYQAFRASCLAQWPADLKAGFEACAAADLQGLHRLAHNLKGSLRLLGETRLAEQALALERACAASTESAATPDWALLRLGWTPLADGLQAWVRDAG